ncbi:MAG: hypothetical protein U0946_00090 [Patescibacteria group bacterium]|nr:hypothetical protein [Patescibacteria group bacterium]
MKLTNRELALTAALAAVSAVLQLIHLGYQSPQWGMWLDLVAVSWLIAFFLFGLRSSFYVSILGFIVITLFAPDTWLGASMKWLATAPMWLSLGFFSQKFKSFQKISSLVLPLTIGLIIRSLIIIPINYYYAIPIWTGMSPIVAIQTIPWYIIFGFNSIQGLIDVILAWTIVYRFRLSRFANSS